MSIFGATRRVFAKSRIKLSHNNDNKVRTYRFYIHSASESLLMTDTKLQPGNDAQNLRPWKTLARGNNTFSICLHECRHIG